MIEIVHKTSSTVKAETVQMISFAIVVDFSFLSANDNLPSNDSSYINSS